MLTLPGVLAGAFGLDQPKRFAVGTPQHVIDEADAFVVRHALDAEFGVVGVVQRPAGLAQQQVDIAVAGLGFVIVVLVGLCLGSLPRRGDLRPQRLQLVVETLPVGEQFCEFAVFCVKLGLLRLHIGKGLFQHIVTARQLCGVESEAVCRLAFAGIGAGQPEADVKQLLHRAGGVAGASLLLLMHRAIAQRVDEFCLREHRLARGLAEGRLVQKCCDIVLIGQLQIGIAAKRPFHRNLHRLAGEERRCRRRHARLTLRLYGRLMNGREFGG
ncbi:hypothetical protein [Bradyrhizobium ottawaense]|uniref:hypothetical protein n=1 Tax=Bradyrhizobium ottawaense TaxID=931866 RepID=UPI0030C6EB1E